MISNRLQGTHCVNPEQGRHRHIPQLEWKCPPKLTLDPDWRVAAGEESTEAVIQRRAPTDPRLHAASLRKAIDHSDSRIPEIPINPIEEEGDLLNNSSAAFLTTAALDSETISLVNKALNALNGVALRQGEPPISMGLFMQWLNSDSVRRFLSRQSFPGIEPESMQNEPTQSVAESSVPLKVTTSNNVSSFNDVDPLPEVTMVPMSPRYSSPSTSWVSNVNSDESIVNEYGTFAGKIMEPIPSWKSITSPVVSLSSPQTTQLSELSRASLLPTENGLASLLYRNPPVPERRQHSVFGTTTPIPMPKTKLVTPMGRGPSLETDFVSLPKAIHHPSPNVIHLPPAIGPSTPLVNSLSLHRNPQIIGQGPSRLKPHHQKPCMYFSTPRGCRNGTSCRYMHSKSNQASPSRVEALPDVKRVKLGLDTSESLYKKR